jgi:hypothetical protein
MGQRDGGEEGRKGDHQHMAVTLGEMFYRLKRYAHHHSCILCIAASIQMA